MNIKTVQYTLEAVTNKRFERANNNNVTTFMLSTKYKYFKSTLSYFARMCIYIVGLCWWKYGINRTDDSPELMSYFTGCALLIDPILAF